MLPPAPPPSAPPKSAVDPGNLIEVGELLDELGAFLRRVDAYELVGAADVADELARAGLAMLAETDALLDLLIAALDERAAARDHPRRAARRARRGAASRRPRGRARDVLAKGAKVAHKLRGTKKGERLMIVVTNRIPVAEGHEADFEDRFKNRVHLVDKAPGFVRNEVHRPKPMKLDHATGTWSPDPDTQGFYEVKTWWRSMDDFVAWTKSPAFAEAHKNRAPKEMFAGPNKLEIHEVFLSTDRSGE